MLICIYSVLQTSPSFSKHMKNYQSFPDSSSYSILYGHHFTRNNRSIMPKNVGKLHGFLGGCNVPSKYIGRGWGVCHLEQHFALIKKKLGFANFLDADQSKVYTVTSIQSIIRKCFKQESKYFFNYSQDIFERY